MGRLEKQLFVVNFPKWEPDCKPPPPSHTPPHRPENLPLNSSTAATTHITQHSTSFPPQPATTNPSQTQNNLPYLSLELKRIEIPTRNLVSVNLQTRRNTPPSQTPETRIRMQATFLFTSHPSSLPNLPRSLNDCSNHQNPTSLNITQHQATLDVTLHHLLTPSSRQ